MTLWFVLALMTAAAIFAVLWPLARHRPKPSGSERLVYRDQLDEIERDRESGLIAEAEAGAARIEISRRLLAAADQPDQPFASSTFRRRVVALVAIVLLPLIAVPIYLVNGSPQIPGIPLAARTNVPLERQSIESMVAQVEAHLERNPEDGRGWEVLGPVYMRMGRYEEAVKARQNAIRLLGATAVREADLGEALIAAANGVVTADAKAALDRAAAADAGEFKAQFLLGLAAEQDGRKGDAARIWRGLLARGASDASWRALVQEALARVDPQATAPGPGADDIAAARSLSPQQRAEMIDGMVARLAARLKEDGSDLDGWQRLVRAYMVLGDADKARAAIADARRANNGDADKQRRLDELAKSLGLDG